MVGGNVIADLEKLVVELVNSLSFPYNISGEINIDEWEKQWYHKIN